MPRIYCYSDGFCEDNGKASAVAGGSYAIYSIDGDKEPSHEELSLLTPIHHEERFLLNTCGTKPTNNVAEAQALLQLTTHLISQGLLAPENKVVVFMDSQLIMYQVLGAYKVKDQKIKQVLKNLYTVFKKWETKHDLKIKDHLDLRWIPGTVMKKTVIGH